MKFRKKPVVIEAVQFLDDGDSLTDIASFMGDVTISYHFPNEPVLHIDTLEGIMTASKGDWIIKGVQGEFYPCKPDIFEKTYEVVNDDQKVSLVIDGNVVANAMAEREKFWNE